MAQDTSECVISGDFSGTGHFVREDQPIKMLYLTSTASLVDVLLLLSIVVLFSAFVAALGSILRNRRRRRRLAGRSVMHAKMMVVLGSGGHTAEILQMVTDMIESAHVVGKIVYVVAETDSHSALKAHALHSQKAEQIPFCIVTLPRAREVGQSYLTSVFTTLYALVYAAKIVIAEAPAALLLNGPGTCVPIAFWAVLFDCLGLRTCSTIYVESVARVETLSLSGRILYPIVRRFIVQWPQLHAKFPLSEHYGRLV
mmetsp:Transcript_5373/g.16033  ORF Transcript_5373/g.16033 Transcript_5373/m.16033 type:complete len:256 (+) Transcript_5373:565-1332(+)